MQYSVCDMQAAVAALAMCREHTCKRAQEPLRMVPAALHVGPLGVCGGPQLRRSCLVILQGRESACNLLFSVPL